MRAIWAVTGALLVSCAGWSSGQAAETGMATPATAPLAANCDAPVAHPGARPHRKVHRTVRRYRPAPVRLVRAMPPPLFVYNPWLPSPLNSSYDRAMVQHFQAPAVSGIFGLDSELPTTPPPVPFQPYRIQAKDTVVQYDGLTGEYIQLAQRDAQRVLAAAPLPVLKED